MSLTVLQVLPALDAGGVEKGSLEVAAELTRRGHTALVMSAGGRMVRDLEDLGVEHIAWPVGRKRLSTLRYVPALRRLFRERHVDIVHVRSRLPAWIVWLARRGLDPATRPRLVSTVHGPYSVNPYSAVMTRGERVIAISTPIRAYILENYPDTDPGCIRLIHRGVDPGDYPHGHRPDETWLAAWRRDHPEIRGRYLITLPARITRWKGQMDFVLMMDRLLRAGEDVHGLIVGGAEPRRREFLREIEARIRTLDLGGRITLTGHRTDLREILAISDLSLSLAREPEAFGRTTLEALRLGTPVIGYDHGGTGEILDAILPAGLVPLGDIGALCERVVAFIHTRPEVPPSDRFTRQEMLDKTLAVYQELSESPC